VATVGDAAEANELAVGVELHEGEERAGSDGELHRRSSLLSGDGV